jgi:hypothetical protein
MEKLDLKKNLKQFYIPSVKKVELVDVPAFQFLMIDGAIEKGLAPGTSPLFQENMSALYGAAYTLKFLIKFRKESPVDFPVMALEGLWWVEDGHFDIKVKDNWFYTVMILVPDLVTQDLFLEALAQLKKKKGDQPGFARLRLEKFTEGLCVQTMHLGSYDAEPVTVERMDAFIQSNHLDKCGKHHEIYLGNPLRSDPVKLKTVLRHPVLRLKPS